MPHLQPGCSAPHFSTVLVSGLLLYDHEAQKVYIYIDNILFEGSMTSLGNDVAVALLNPSCSRQHAACEACWARWAEELLGCC